MISIVNKGPHDDPDPMGKRTYHLSIWDGKNTTVICEFQHIRSEGLATCLRKAAEAVDEQG